jgi:hypothetical protein
MHARFSQAAQPFPTAQYAIFIAEIASTFNENMLVNRMLQGDVDDRVKLSLLGEYLDRMRGTIYGQTMLADFELAMHREVEQGRSLTASWLDKTFMATYRDYMGVDQGVVKVDDCLGVSWAAVPHFYRRYYVFQYVTGMVASSALSEAVLRGGEKEAGRYLAMLRAGGSKFPLEILRDAGVDLSQPQPIEAAIKQFDRLVGQMEEIYARTANGGAFTVSAKENGTVQAESAAGKVVIAIRGGRGIGSGKVECKLERWPAEVMLRAYLGGLESLTMTCGGQKLSVSVLSHGANEVLQHGWEDGREGPELAGDDPLRMTVRRFDADGKPAAGLPPRGGWFELRVPAALLQRGKELTLEWVDFFR